MQLTLPAGYHHNPSLNTFHIRKEKPRYLKPYHRLHISNFKGCDVILDFHGTELHAFLRWLIFISYFIMKYHLLLLCIVYSHDCTSTLGEVVTRHTYMQTFF